MTQIFVDMDGVLAKWGPGTQKDTFQTGYFRSREPETAIIELVKEMERQEMDVTILSSAYLTTNARHEKADWLAAYGVDVPAIFVPYGMNKEEFIPDIGDDMILIDDFSRNLHSWIASSPRHKAVKFMNGINGSNGTWKGAVISPEMSVNDMLLAIINA